MRKKIVFLLLHLSYGGIESATVNTANCLIEDFDIELYVTYKMKKEITNSIDKRVKVKYLTDTCPNRDEFNRALREFRILRVITEGMKSLRILYLKSKTLKDAIKNTNHSIIISTRVEYSKILASLKGNNIGIGIEHRFHNNDHKYINEVKKAYKNMDYLLLLSEGINSDFNKFFPKNRKVKLRVVPNMLLNNFNETSQLENKKIVAVGRLHPVKGFDRLLDIFKDFKSVNPDWKLQIIGEGSEMDKLERMIEKNAIESVELTGRLSHRQVMEQLKNSSIYVMTSHSEGLPMVLLEAMSVGLPCIAYNVNVTFPSIIQNDDNGYLVKNGDKQDFIKKLNRVAKDKSLRLQLGDRAQLKADNYSAENVKKIWLKILDEI